MQSKLWELESFPLVTPHKTVTRLLLCLLNAYKVAFRLVETSSLSQLTCKRLTLAL